MVVDNPYGFIYITTNLANGKRYIGQKKIDGKHRYYIGSGVLLKKAIIKYGKDTFRRDIVSFADTFEELNKQEKELISFFDATKSNDFYNIEEGGWSYPLAESTKALIKKNHAHLRGEANPMYGRKLSEESKQRIGEALKGKVPINKGVPMSEEQKAKLRESWKNREVKVNNHREIYCVEEDKIYYSIAELSREKNLVYGSIINVLKKKRNSLYGKHYIYADEREEMQYGKSV